MLDSWRDPARDVRIAVESWIICEAITNQFIERPHSSRMVWNYLLHVGPAAVWRKIRSRLGERSRNSKIAGIGVGRILERPEDSGLNPGDRVIFFAPNHSKDWPRITLDFNLVGPASESANSLRALSELPETLRTIVGWSPYSGAAPDFQAVKQELRRVASDCGLIPTEVRRRGSVGTDDADPHECVHGPAVSARQPTAVLFGLGNYSKTQIVQHVRRHLHLEAIHEIDPDQIDSAKHLATTLDTSPWPRTGEKYDAWFVAGFHHTHAPIAVHALNSGSYAVVEKPIVTTRPQLVSLTEALRGRGSRKLFSCFQKRYSRINDWIKQDLGISANEPLDMHCLVYEIPAPALHWYNWPNSGSRLISNGCHWLDYFLYMNGFSPVTSFEITPLRKTDFCASMRLANGAQMTMSLTDTGSARLGVRDVIELRAGGVTARLVDASYYEAENTSRVLRRRTVNPMQAYQRMYDDICRRIAAGADGDPHESLRSTELMLDLEDEMRLHKKDRVSNQSVPREAVWGAG